MNKEELKAYVEDNRKALIAEAVKYLDEEDGRHAPWGEVNMRVYYDQWDLPESDRSYYKVVAHSLQELPNGMIEENMDYFVEVVEIKWEV
jgi:hypothetical protein